MKTNIRINCAPLLILMMASVGSAAGERVAEAELHENVTNAFINPGKASNLPRVLIIGDSISIGYTDPVRSNLKGIADVSRPPVNCLHTGYGLAQIKTWLGTNKWDVIHFNFGIWDTYRHDPKVPIPGKTDENQPASNIGMRHTPEQYRQNLTQLVEILKGTGAKLIWASTTPVMSRTGEWFVAIPKFNLIAAELMKSNGIAMDDLNAFVLPHLKEWQRPDQCHFNTQGNEQLGKQVTECIQRAINGQEDTTGLSDQGKSFK